MKKYAPIPDFRIFFQSFNKYKDSENYTLTFSRAEDNDHEVFEALKLGANVSAVFANELPDVWNKYPVIN